MTLSYPAPLKFFWALSLLGLAAGLALPTDALAKSPTFYIQETVRDLRPIPQEPVRQTRDAEMEAMPVVQTQHFTLQETIYSQPQPQHGVVGLDMQIQRGKYPIVKQVFQGTPAHREGFLPGDVILSVNGLSTMGRTYDEVDFMISDVPGEEVDFTVSRGNQIKRIRLTVMALQDGPGSLQATYADLFPTP